MRLAITVTPQDVQAGKELTCMYNPLANAVRKRFPLSRVIVLWANGEIVVSDWGVAERGNDNRVIFKLPEAARRVLKNMQDKAGYTLPFSFVMYTKSPIAAGVKES